jgi:hypothetical protein
MHKTFTLPKPLFIDWLFGIRPEVVAFAHDGPGNKSTIHLTCRGAPLGVIVVEFADDQAVTLSEEAINAGK